MFKNITKNIKITKYLDIIIYTKFRNILTEYLKSYESKNIK